MIKKAQGRPDSCSINHSGEGGFLDCFCPWLWCNQRVRPCCSQPETQHLMRMLCTGSLSHTNPVSFVSLSSHNCAEYHILFFFDSETSLTKSKIPAHFSHGTRVGISKLVYNNNKMFEILNHLCIS